MPLKHEGSLRNALEEGMFSLGFPGGLGGEEFTCNAAALWVDLGSVPGSGRSPGEGTGNPLQYSCLDNPMDRGACGLQSMWSQRVGHN